MSSPTTLLPFQPLAMSPAQLAAVSYLARYSGRTHALYAFQLRRWFSWCESNGLDPLIGIQRAHVELYIRQLGESGLMDSSVVTMMHGIRGFFRYAHIDGTTRLPKIHRDECRTQGLARDRARLAGPGDLPRRTHLGPLILRPLTGKPVDRRDVYRMVQRIARAAGIPRHISPHSLRHAAITNALDAGVPLRDAQILARHADPRTTEHYDRARGNLDRHGVHFLTAYVAGV
jgi:integrase/recombinase XerD